MLFSILYFKRLGLDYNSEGRFLAIDEGVVYHKQWVEIYGALAILGLILTTITLVRLLKKMKQ